MNEQKLYDFALQNVMDLIDGKLTLDKIIKLRAIDFSFDFYIDEVCREFMKRLDEQ